MMRHLHRAILAAVALAATVTTVSATPEIEEHCLGFDLQRRPWRISECLAFRLHHDHACREQAQEIATTLTSFDPEVAAARRTYQALAYMIDADLSRLKVLHIQEYGFAWEEPETPIITCELGVNQ